MARTNGNDQQGESLMMTLNHKIAPSHAYLLIQKSTASPVFISFDWHCFKFIKNRGGICLFCKNKYALTQYDFSFCYQREMWVIFVHAYDYNHAIQLGRHVQLSGATKVLIIPIKPELISEARYDNR